MLVIPIILVCWFLFAFPAIIFMAMVLGAQLHAKGRHGQVPGIAPIRFGVSRRQDNGQQQAERLPEV